MNILDKKELLYLRGDIQIEPLVAQWYAWTHLISPATAARNFTERHLKIMDSYINAPEIHANAVRNPKLLGGPFVDYEGKRVDEIRRLRDQTKTQCADLLDLSEALAQLDRLVRSSAKGGALDSLYAAAPEILKGYFELGYDLSHHPCIRILEHLLYRSKYYDPSMQSVMLSLTRGDDRPFALSTPRLENVDSLHLCVPFSDVRLDKFFELTSTPQPCASVRDMFDLNEHEERLLRNFLTETPPKARVRSAETFRWRYFGHACVLVENRGVSILVDPVISYSYSTNLPRFTYEDLPERIDYVLLTHNHQDHVLLETLLHLRHRVRHMIVPKNSGGFLHDPSLKLTLRNMGFDNVVELDEFETLPIPDGSISGVPFLGEHGDLSVRAKVCYCVRVGSRALLFAADSCSVEPKVYEHVFKEIGPIDTVFVGMECDGAPLSWLYGPLFSQRLSREMDDSRRLNAANFNQAERLIESSKCSRVYVYAMGQEPWLNYVMSLKYTDQSRPIVESNRLIEVCRSRGIQAERLYCKHESRANN